MYYIQCVLVVLTCADAGGYDRLMGGSYAPAFAALRVAHKLLADVHVTIRECGSALYLGMGNVILFCFDQSDVLT